MNLVKGVWTDITTHVDMATVLQNTGGGSIDLLESDDAPTSIEEAQEALSLYSGSIISYKAPTAPKKTWARGNGNTNILARGYN